MRHSPLGVISVPHYRLHVMRHAISPFCRIARNFHLLQRIGLDQFAAMGCRKDPELAYDGGAAD